MRKELEEEREIFKFWTNSGKKVHNIINKKDFKKKIELDMTKLKVRNQKLMSWSMIKLKLAHLCKLLKI